MGKNAVIRSQTRKMVFNVYSYLSREASTERGIVKRTADATKISKFTVSRIVSEGKSTDFGTSFKTPGKKRAKESPITDINCHVHFIIRNFIHNYHTTYNKLPNTEIIKEKLKQDVNFNGSDRSMLRILKKLGFRWKKAEGNKQLLLEKTKIRLLRIEYLEKITKYRKEGRPIVYTDESFLHSTHSGFKTCSDGELKMTKKRIKNTQKIVVVHAGYAAGFIPNALLIFDNELMDYENYVNWLRFQLIPNLPPNAVLVIDNNAFYPNKQFDPAPTSTAHKAAMQKWLMDKNIKFDKNLLKPQLYKLIKLYKEQHKSYHVDKILAEHNHTVLRLPPYHPDLNPIKMIWEEITEYVASKNITWNVPNVIALVKEKISQIGSDDWLTLVDKVQKYESDYIKSDHLVDDLTEQYNIISPSDDSDSSESTSGDESDLIEDE